MAKKKDKQEEFRGTLKVDFKEINMKAKDKMWTDDMSKSIFNTQPGLPNNGTSGGKASTEPIKINTRNMSSRNSKFANKFK